MSRLSIRGVDFLKATPAIIAFYALSLGAFALSYNANTTAVQEAEERAEQFEAQSERLRVAFCGIVEPFGFNAQPAASPAGEELKRSFQRAASSEGLQCTPDRGDGR
jgi:hypothetical protein